MKIAIVGLGLIGGSVCKALKKNTFHHIMGLDADGEVCRKALDSGAIDEIITADGLNDADMTMLCLYPETIVEFVKQHKDRFKPGSIVTDSCGVKEYVVTRCTEELYLSVVTLWQAVSFPVLTIRPTICSKVQAI